MDSTYCKGKSEVDATISEDGLLVAKMGASLSAGALQVTSGKLTGITRGRVIPPSIQREF